MDLECLDLSWTTRGGELCIEAVTADGLIRMPAPFDPYFYVKKKAYDPTSMRFCECWLAEDTPDGFLKLETDHPANIRDYDDRTLYDTYEADVRYDRRVCIDEDVTFRQPDPQEVLYFDIEVDDRGQFTDPEDADSRVITVAAIDGTGERFYFDHSDERLLLSDFIEAAKEYRVLVGWNSLDYDFRFLENRCVRLGIDVTWRRWVRHDLMPLYDMLAIPTMSVSTALDDSGERELGISKTGVQAGDGRLWELYKDDPDQLREYNMRDVELTKGIAQKYDLVSLLHVICDLCNYPPGSSCYLTKHDRVMFAIGMVVDAKVLEVAHDKGIPQPNRRAFDKPDDFPGGYVLEPKPGMYEGLVVPDYSGMYPSIIRSFNFGRETWVPDDVIEMERDGADSTWRISEGEYEGQRAIKGEHGGFVHPEDGPRSVPAEAADELVTMREGADVIVDKGVKAVNNCYSGDTAVMTPDRGPVNIKELEVGDEVYSINPDTMECEVKPVVETVAEPNAYGELVHIKGSGVDLKVTPNHRMLVSKYRSDSFDFHEAHELESGRWDLPKHEPVEGRKPDELDLMQDAEGRVLVDHDCHGRTFMSHIDGAKHAGNRGGYWLDMGAFWKQEDEVLEFADVVGVQHHTNGKLTPLRHDTGDMLELMGWYIAEGGLNAADSTRVTIAQEDDEARARIAALLESMDIPHKVYDTHIRISDKNLAKWLSEECGCASPEKRIPEWAFELDHTLLERLHESLMAGDGTSNNGNVKYTTISDRLRDDFARLMLHLGTKMRFRRDPVNERQPDTKRAHRVHENCTDGIAGPRNVTREDHDGMVYCVSVLDNHTVLAGRNGVMQWTGQTLYGIFASDFHRYFGPHSQNITLIGQELTGIVEEIASSGHKDISDVVYGDTDSVMIDMALDANASDEAMIEAAHRISEDVEEEMQDRARERGALARFLQLDVDDVYDRFYIGDRKKRYFGHRIFDGEPCDSFKVRGYETRQSNYPDPVRDFQEKLMHAVLDDEPTGPVIDEAHEKLFSGVWDLEMSTATRLGQPVEEYATPQPHTRAAEAIRNEFGEGAVQVGDKVTYVKYGPSKTDVSWVHAGAVERDFRPNEGYCSECDEVVAADEHGHDTAGFPYFRNEHYSYLWDDKFVSVMESIGVSEQTQTSLGDF